MLDPSNFDPRPLRVRVPEALAKYPEGLSTKDLAAVLGDPQYTISSVVSKMASYGDRIVKVGSTHGQGCKWKLKPSAGGFPRVAAENLR